MYSLPSSGWNRRVGCDPICNPGVQQHGFEKVNPAHRSVCFSHFIGQQQQQASKQAGKSTFNPPPPTHTQRTVLAGRMLPRYMVVSRPLSSPNVRARFLVGRNIFRENSTNTSNQPNNHTRKKECECHQQKVKQQRARKKKKEKRKRKERKKKRKEKEKKRKEKEKKGKRKERRVGGTDAHQSL